MTANEPVISVDTKKKELVGNFKNNGREWRPKGRPELVRIHDFIDPKHGGGSNGYRVRLWKIELQRLADEVKLPITVCHLPPGTSKWDKIEHMNPVRE